MHFNVNSSFFIIFAFNKRSTVSVKMMSIENNYLLLVKNNSVFLYLDFVFRCM